MPLVSVVVIGYNDAAHLATAVRSATRQSFRDLEIIVVDDASTDGMPDVARRLAADDGRVRVIRLEENSGGCSRPRNVGVEAAAGRYVLFLDSDDELPRHAVTRLVEAAESADAELACGRWVRRHHHPRRVITAHDELYTRPAVLSSILDRPGLLYDTPAWNKLYRRSLITDNGLQFPEGLLYEDLLFTTEAYCAARGIAVIPDLVYVWHVRRAAAEPSITNRADVRIWRDRFEVHRRIDAFLVGHSIGRELVAAKQRKFLDADFVLFLRDLRQTPAARRTELLSTATGYVAALELDALPSMPAPVRAALHAVARGELTGSLEAADWTVTGSVGGELVRDGSRLLWTPSDAPSSDAVDVTDSGLLAADLATTPFPAVVRGAHVNGPTVGIDGEVRDVLGRLGTPPSVARLEIRARLGGLLATVPVTVAPGGPGVVLFRTELDVNALGSRLLTPRAGPELRFVLVLAGPAGTAMLPLTARDAELPAADVHVPTRWRPLTGDRVRLRELNGRFVAQLSALPSASDRAIEAATRARNGVRRTRLRLRSRHCS